MWQTLVGHDVGMQLLLLGSAFVLCSVIGVERQVRRKSAGYSTHVLVGLGSCVFTLISAYGFAGLIDADTPHDPTRIAAQVVSGIGFLGAGVIFKGSSTVRGLTTAGSIWITAAVGMACAAGMIAVAGAATAVYLITLLVVAPLVRKIPTESADTSIRVVYTDGTGAMRHILEVASSNAFSTAVEGSRKTQGKDGATLVTVDLRFLGPTAPETMIPALMEVPGMLSVKSSKPTEAADGEDVD